VIATKYGFYSKSDMAEMRVKLIPLDVQRDRTVRFLSLEAACLYIS
jgi:hypothetical protein